MIPDDLRRRSPNRLEGHRGRHRPRSSRTAPPPPVRSSAGHLVLFGKYSGDEIKLDGEEHIILREDDILAIIEN